MTPAPTTTIRPTIAAPPPKDIGCDAIVANHPGPYPEAPIPPPPTVTVAGGDAASGDAIVRAADALAHLTSYQFTVDIVGRDISTLQATTFDFFIRGTIDHSTDFALDGVLASRLREGNGSGAVTSGGQVIKAGHGYVWQADNVSEVPEPRADPGTLASIGLFTPEGSLTRYLLPFAAGYRRIGPERHDGIRTQHYRASTKGLAAYTSTMQFKGPMTADVWIAADGGYLVGARVTGKAHHIDPTFNLDVDDGFVLETEVTHPNDPANVVTLPATPVADPIRPTGAPVDLMLTYRVLPKAGVEPAAADLDAIGVALRTRLDISARPIRVDTVGIDKVIVKVCGTTTPDADRRLITSGGALTAVPLPKDRFGTTAQPGPTALPAVGSQLDPTLQPIAPASGLGLTTAHVDPETGRRGLALHLSNQATDAMSAYAATHRNEFIAVVLDGTVLATMPIDDRVARGNLVFTGDYTGAETRLMASYLYRDPILFQLQPIEDVELPAQGPPG